MKLTYLDFELEIGTEQGREFPVVARSPAGEARATMRFPYDELGLESRLKDLQIALLRSGGKRRQMLSPEQQAVRDFGQALFDSLITGEVRSRYDTSLQQARTQGKGLRIRLRFQSPLAAALPWEYLYDPRLTEYCCLSVETPLVRYLELPQSISPLAVAPPLRMLGLVANPSDLPALDVTQEKQRIEQAVRSLRQAGRIELEWLSGQTWRDLQGALRSGPWHIFHFSGHGRFDSLTDEGQLAFADDQGRAQLLSANDVGRLLANHRTLRLAWLNACEGARGGNLEIFSSTASVLVRRGIPAVVAMQYEITDRGSIELARTFYEALAAGYPVDAALAEARVAVSLAVNNTVEWGTPVLYMRAPDGVLFDLAVPTQVAQTRTEALVPITIAAKPASEPIRPEAQESAPVGTPAQPVSGPMPPTTVQEPRRRWLGCAFLPIAVLAVVIGAMIIICNGLGIITGRPTPTPPLVMAGGVRATQTAAAQAENARAAQLALTATAASAPTATATPEPPTAMPEPPTATPEPPTAMPEPPTATPEPPTATPEPPTATPEPPTPTTLPGKVVLTDDGAIVTEPVRMELVRVPAGQFLMGTDHTKDSLLVGDDRPQHLVTLDEFYIDKYEVTNAQYATFVKAKGYDAPDDWVNGSVLPNQDDYPVVYVSWNDAVAFTKWLGEETGKSFRLCTEAEWEKACRGTSGLIYPWGDTFDKNKANTWESGIGTTTPTGKYSPDGDSPYGAADMAGNVWEWVADWYAPNYYDFSPAENPQGPESGDRRVLRGGTFYPPFEGYASCSYRSNSGLPDDRSDGMGFRACAVIHQE